MDFEADYLWERRLASTRRTMRKRHTARGVCALEVHYHPGASGHERAHLILGCILGCAPALSRRQADDLGRNAFRLRGR
jgi:hypothetical protein